MESSHSDVSSLIQDLNNCFYLHPNENPGLIFVSPPLTGSNYHHWSRTMMVALMSKNKYQFVDGSIRVLEKDDPLFLTWQRCNTMVLTWLNRSLSPSIAQSVIWLNRAMDVWNDLHERFNHGDTFRVAELQEELYQFRQENQIREPSMSTVLVNYHNDFDPYKATSTPIYQTATFKMTSATQFDEYAYSRITNPTRDTLEKLLAKLDNADKAFCFASGMTALTAVCELVNPGDEIISSEDIYGGSYKFLHELIARKGGVKVKKVNTTDIENVKATMGLKTKLIWLESPSNPQLTISDIRKISEIAHAHGAIVLVDNSSMSPVLSQPLDLGADIVMHSNTKLIAGNSSVLAGSLATRDEGLAKRLESYKNTTGVALSPFASWLCLEGIKTMALRVKEKQSNAQIVAEFLASHPRVKKINYPGLPSHPGYDLHNSQAKGPGSLISFTTGSLPLSKHIVENTEYFSMSVSFGSVGSSICLPWYTSHNVIPEGERTHMGLSKDLVRISVGIEDVSDLITDLDKALSSGPL